MFLPAGNYYISSHLTVPAAVTLKGVAVAPFRTYGTPGQVVGIRNVVFSPKRNNSFCS